MRVKSEIEKRRDNLRMEAQKLSSSIKEIDAKIKEIINGNENSDSLISLIKEKERIHVSLGIINSRWSEVLWILEETK